jgi:hypothetical protein
MAALPIPLDDNQAPQYVQKPGLMKTSDAPNRRVYLDLNILAVQPPTSMLILEAGQSAPAIFSVLPQEASKATWTMINVGRELAVGSIVIPGVGGLWASPDLVGAPRLETIADAMRDLEALRRGEDDVPPTEHAYRNARNMIDSSYRLLLAEYSFARLPSPVISTDDIGGVRFTWRSGSKVLRANFGALPESRSYLYHQSGDQYDAEPLHAVNLSERLSWIIAR